MIPDQHRHRRLTRRQRRAYVIRTMSARRKVGRPARYDGLGRNRFQVVLTDAQLEEITAAAERDGMGADRSAWVREGALERAGGAILIPRELSARVRAAAKQAGLPAEALAMAWLIDRLK